MRKYLCFILCGLLFLCFSGCGKKEGKPVFPDFNPYGVSRIEIQQDDSNHIKIFKDNEKNWFVETSDMVFFADSEKVCSFLKLIGSFKYVRVPDKDCGKLEKMSERKGHDVKIETSKGTIAFSVKKSGEDYQSSYIRLEGDKSCILCEPYINTVLTEPFRKWLKYSVFDQDITRLSTINVEANGEKLLNLRVQPGEPDWINTYDNKKYCLDDIIKLNEVLTRMRVCNGEKLNDKVLADQPVLKIETVSREGKIFYIQIEGKKNSSFYYSRRSGRENGILIISKTWLNKFNNILSNLFDIEINF